MDLLNEYLLLHQWKKTKYHSARKVSSYLVQAKISPLERKEGPASIVMWDVKFVTTLKNWNIETLTIGQVPLLVNHLR